MIDPKNLMAGSSAEHGLEESLKVISTLELETFDFIGTESTGFVITNRGKNNIAKLASFVQIEPDIFKEPIKSTFSVMLYFSNKKLEVRQAIQKKLQEHKESRESAMIEANKSEGLSLPPGFTEGLERGG